VGCGEGRRPVVVKEAVSDRRHGTFGVGAGRGSERQNTHGFNADGDLRPSSAATITGYTCACDGDGYRTAQGLALPPTTPGVVLDPFGGTGTTALVATMLGRHGISLDLSADYNRLAHWRASDPKERARAAGLDPDAVSKLRAELPGQDSLFDSEVAS
jgi:hypothetical protein